MTLLYRCPTDPTPYDDPQPHDPPEGMAGCGTVFACPDLDGEGFADCPHCGMWFAPREEDIVRHETREEQARRIEQELDEQRDT